MPKHLGSLLNSEQPSICQSSQSEVDLAQLQTPAIDRSTCVSMAVVLMRDWLSDQDCTSFDILVFGRKE